MKIIITESQYKKVLLREFGETVEDPKKWYRMILKWVDNNPKRLSFDSKEYETIAYDDKGIYLGYYDKEGNYGFVVTEYGIGVDDYTDVYPDEILDEEETAGGAPAGGTPSVWPLSDLVRSVANTLTNDPHYTSGPHPTSSSWEDKKGRGPSNQLT
jgi:hypothetical protein